MTLHVCQHPQPGYTHLCGCGRGRNHKFSALIQHYVEPDPTERTLFDIGVDGEIAI